MPSSSRRRRRSPPRRRRRGPLRGVAEMANCILAQFSQLHVSSTIRSSADAGTCSHADGNAVDIGDGTGGSAYMDNVAQWVSDDFSSVSAEESTRHSRRGHSFVQRRPERTGKLLGSESVG